MALQHGVPLQVLVGKLSHTRFEPSGWTGNEQLGYAKSIMDYIFRWLELRFLSSPVSFVDMMLVLLESRFPWLGNPSEETVSGADTIEGWSNFTPRYCVNQPRMIVIRDLDV